MVLAVIDDRGRLSKETGIVREDNRELRAIVDAQTTRILKWRLRYLRSEEKTKAPCEKLQKAKNRLTRVAPKLKTGRIN